MTCLGSNQSPGKIHYKTRNRQVRAGQSQASRAVWPKFSLSLGSQVLLLVSRQNPLLHADPAVLAAIQNDPRSLRRALISQRLHKEPGDGILFQTPKLLRAGLRDCQPATSQNSSLLSRDQGFDSMVSLEYFHFVGPLQPPAG